jgi:hypothetical protein
MVDKAHKLNDSAYPSFIYFAWGMPATPKIACFVSQAWLCKLSCLGIYVRCFLITQHYSFPLQRTVYKISSKM